MTKKIEKLKQLATNKLIDVIRHTFSDDVVFNYLEDLEKEKNKYIDMNRTVDEYPYLSPMTTCASRKNTKSVKKLLEMGANPNQCNIFGFSPLNWAAFDGNVEMATDLLNHNANIYYKDNQEKQCSTTIAFINGNKQLFVFLISHIDRVDELERIRKEIINKSNKNSIEMERIKYKVSPTYAEECIAYLGKIILKYELDESIEVKKKLLKVNKV